MNNNDLNSENIIQNGLVIYSSYPKTGSTFLPDLLEKCGILGTGTQIQYFVWNKGKHNIKINDDTFLVKTHHTIGDWYEKLRKNPDELIWITNFTKSEKMNVFNGQKVKYIYTLRNPFNVLNSGIKYSKLLYQRENVSKVWREDGRAEGYFINLLGFKDIPTPQEFENFSLLELEASNIEDILWRYIEGWGTIPIFEPGEMLSYFRHVNYYNKLLSDDKIFAKLSYEGLMSRDVNMYESVSKVLGIPTNELLRAYDEDLEDKQNQSNKYKSPFYAGFNLGTPDKIKNLSSYNEMKKYIQCVCPSLYDLLD